MHTKGEPPRIIRPTILEDGPEFDVYGDGLPEATFLRRGLDVSQREFIGRMLSHPFEFMKESPSLIAVSGLRHTCLIWVMSLVFLA